mgnify:FL=1|tara:strand:+ start:372 stop:635 length:264 start_codon:yes stop_codon:yes gene_type:complete
MLKELRYLMYASVLVLVLFLTINFYFSDFNKKNSYRAFKKTDEKIIEYSQNLNLLKNDTNNIIEFVEITTNKNKKNYNFWKLITNND